jgi:ADP-glucose pyrophosphorylase
MSGTRIEAGARVEYSIVDADTVICAGAVVGAKNDEEKIAVVGTKLTIPAGMTIAAGDMINEAKLSQLREGGNV